MPPPHIKVYDILKRLVDHAIGIVLHTEVELHIERIVEGCGERPP